MLQCIAEHTFYFAESVLGHNSPMNMISNVECKSIAAKFQCHKNVK